MGKRVELTVCAMDRAPMFGTGGPLVSIWDADRKSTAAKLPEEAAEAFGEWQEFERMASELRAYCDFAANEDPELARAMRVDLRRQRDKLGDELSDVLVNVADIAMICDVDLQAALDRNEERQAERGRIIHG